MELKSSSSWLSDSALMGGPGSLVVDQGTHYWLSALDQLSPQYLAAALDDDVQNSVSAESHTSSYPIFSTSPPKTPAMAAESGSRPTPPAELPQSTGSWNSSRWIPTAAPDAPSPRILSFCPQDGAEEPGHLPPSSSIGHHVSAKPENAGFSIALMAAQAGRRAAKFSGARPPSHARDHLIAERKRRERISEMIIALSAVIPGLKKMDKASVLGDAIKYVKELQQRLKTLEEKAARTTVESVLLVKKSRLPSAADEGASSSGEISDDAAAALSGGGHGLPEVEAKVSERSVLLRIHCEERKGVLVRVMEEVEKLHLDVVNASAMPFAGSTLQITMVAQMGEDFSMTAQDLVMHLNSACR